MRAERDRIDPIREFPEILLVSCLFGFGCWSFAILGITFVALYAVLFTRVLRPWFVAALCSLWAVVGYQFFEAFFRNLFKAWSWGHTAAIVVAVLVFALSLILKRLPSAAWVAEVKPNQAEKGESERFAQQQEGSCMEAEAQFDPYAILELEPTPTLEQVKSRYRHALAMYHPDKVQHLGLELRKLAHEKTLQIRRAFDSLSEAK